MSIINRDEELNVEQPMEEYPSEYPSEYSSVVAENSMKGFNIMGLHIPIWFVFAVVIYLAWRCNEQDGFKRLSSVPRLSGNTGYQNSSYSPIGSAQVGGFNEIHAQVGNEIMNMLNL